MQKLFRVLTVSLLLGPLIVDLHIARVLQHSALLFIWIKVSSLILFGRSAFSQKECGKWKRKIIVAATMGLAAAGTYSATHLKQIAFVFFAGLLLCGDDALEAKRQPHDVQ